MENTKGFDMGIIKTANIKQKSGHNVPADVYKEFLTAQNVTSIMKRDKIP